jgi:hypothetical protein
VLVLGDLVVAVVGFGGGGGEEFIGGRSWIGDFRSGDGFRRGAGEEDGWGFKARVY